MDYLEHIKGLKEKLKNPIKGIPISFPTFNKYYPYFEKGHRLLLAADTGIGKTTIIIKSFILDIIDYVLANPSIDCRIYYFSIENHRSVVISKIYLYLIAKYLGRNYTLTELMNPSSAQTIEDIEKMTPKMDKITKKLLVFDSLHEPTEIYQFMLKEMSNYGKIVSDPKGGKSYIYNNPDMYIFCITDTINALNPDPGLNEYDSIKRWTKNYCKLSLSTIMGVIPINVSQLDNSVSSNMYSNSGTRVEEKHEPTLGQMGDVKTTPRDHTLVMSLFVPERYGISSYMGYDIKRIKGSYINFRILKNNFGMAGREICSHLYFDGNKGDYQELPDSEDKAAVDAFLTSKGIGKLAANSSAKKIDNLLI